MEKLKKCPFCGGEAKIKMERKNNVGWTICIAWQPLPERYKGGDSNA